MWHLSGLSWPEMSPMCSCVWQATLHVEQCKLKSPLFLAKEIKIQKFKKNKKTKQTKQNKQNKMGQQSSYMDHISFTSFNCPPSLSPAPSSPPRPFPTILQVINWQLYIRKAFEWSVHERRRVFHNADRTEAHLRTIAVIAFASEVLLTKKHVNIWYALMRL